MSPIVGIDLGTTNSGVAVVRQGQPVMLPNQSERIIPSVVGYSPAGQWLVGTPARNQYVLYPEQTVRSIKRKMGSAEQINLAGRTFNPPEISAFILKELKAIAERNLGQPVSEAVITVPAYFPDAARQATRAAGSIAGFEVRRIINEPTAAALAYGLNQASDQLVLVYDLGGGTFDVSLVELMGGVVEVRASHGNTRLGGDDFDQLLAEQLATWFEQQHGVDVRQERRAWARLLRAAETAKMQLSSQPFAWVKEEYLAEKRGIPLHLEYEVARPDFERLIAGLLDQTLASIRQVLQDARLQPADVSQVLLVGGSTYIPAVWELVAGELPLEPLMGINPEEAVALGAGVQAAIIAGEPIDAILVDVTPHSLGIAVAERFIDEIYPNRYAVLIRRNTTIPTTRANVFSTIHPEQDTIKVEVYQGESPVASENLLLGEFLVTDLEPEHPGELAQVTVEFDFDVNGILKVTASDRRSGNQKAIEVHASKARLSEADIMESQHRLAELYDGGPEEAAEGPGALAAGRASAEARVLLERARARLQAGRLPPADQARLTELVADVESAAARGPASRLEDLLETLLELLFDLEE